MANAEINIVVNGEEKLKDIQKDIEGISTKSVAMGNIYAKMAEGAVQAFSYMIDAGSDYNDTLDEMNGKTRKSVTDNDALSVSFGALSASITENAHSVAILGAAKNELGGWFDSMTAFFSGTTTEAIQAQNQAMLDYAENMEKWAVAKKAMAEGAKAYAKELAAENRETEKATRLLAAYNGQQAEKAHRHQEQIDITREMINIYEEQGRSTDALVASLEQLEELDINHVDTIREKAEAQAITNQMTDDARKSTQDYTEAVYENTYALKKNMEETMPQGMGGAELPSGNYSKNELDRMRDPNGAYQKNRQSSYLKDIARSSRDTNDAVRGY